MIRGADCAWLCVCASAREGVCAGSRRPALRCSSCGTLRSGRRSGGVWVSHFCDSVRGVRHSDAAPRIRAARPPRPPFRGWAVRRRSYGAGGFGSFPRRCGALSSWPAGQAPLRPAQGLRAGPVVSGAVASECGLVSRLAALCGGFLKRRYFVGRIRQAAIDSAGSAGHCVAPLRLRYWRTSSSSAWSRVGLTFWRGERK